jgi:formimidoylglutamate deiminase
MAEPSPRFWAERAYINGAWQQRVLLTVDGAGNWSGIRPNTPAPNDAVLLQAPVLPSLVNAHSHAFQRAFAGLSERRDSESDNFWSWRERMYSVAQRVTPEHLEAIAAQLYAELLEGGYTQACEFHYLHHAPQGSAYADPHRMAWALTGGAAQAGLGITLLPVLYERAGFAVPQLHADQVRFAADADFVMQLKQAVDAARLPLVNTGVAVHSLRAARPESVHTLKALMQGGDGLLHIHVAEQTAEVNDCIAATGQRPVQWLAAQSLLDARWHLVHATHVNAQEIDAVAHAGAQLVICPSTEANLGDGLTDVAHWLGAGVGMAIGSDSHVSRTWREELRWLEYGQRLHAQQRNVCAAPASGQSATAQRLFDAALAGGARAAGFARQGLVVGARADMLVLDSQCAGLLGVPPDYTLDALVFACDSAAIDAVYVAGKQVVKGGRHVAKEAIAARYVEAMRVLWQSAF